MYSNKNLLMYLLIIFFAGFISVTSAEIMVKYDFNRLENKILDASGNNRDGLIKGKVLFEKIKERKVAKLDGRKCGFDIQNSNNLNAGKSSSYEATVMFLDKLSPYTSLKNLNSRYDAIFYKHNQFVMSRRGDQLYCNFHDGKGWAGQLLSPKTLKLKPKKWYHLVLVFEHHNEPSQGAVWGRTRLYVNGKCVVSKKFPYTKPVDRNCAIELGKADKFGKGWNMHGKIAQAAIYNKSLSRIEVQKLTLAEPLVKPAFERPNVISNNLKKRFKEVRKKIQKSSNKKIATALLQSLENLAYTPKCKIKTIPLLEKLEGLIKKSIQSKELLREWNSGNELWALDSKDALLSFTFNPLSDYFCLAGIFNKKKSSVVIDYNSKVWELKIAKGNKTYYINSTSSGIKALLIKKPELSFGKWKFSVKWTHEKNEINPVSFYAISNFTFQNGRLEYDLSVQSNSKQDRLTEVTFPSIKIRKLSGDKNILLTPCTSGVEYFNPIATQTGYFGEYPTGTCAMQMGAYYNNNTGVYFATEDINACSKTLSFQPNSNNLYIAYTWSPGYYPGKKNSFHSKCKAVFQIYNGGWYDAGLLYRKWLKNLKAPWWITSLPREDTPKWFRDNLMWIRGEGGSIKELTQVKEFVKLPFAIHLYSWHGKHDDDYPHYNPLPGVLEKMQKRKKLGIKTIPYANGRLWDTKDKGNQDWQYTSLALPNTIKTQKGRPVQERYNNRYFGVMCPFTKLWQDKMYSNTQRILSWGFDGIYYDQVAACGAVLCFDKNHGHKLADCNMWFKKGYYPMFKRIKKMMREDYPQAVLTSEDHAEPYMHAFDGYLPWRWMFNNQVPLYILVYSGRVQFTGLCFGREDATARTIMLAKQLVYGEQLGWIGIDRFFKPEYKNYRKVIRLLMHIRHGMLKFFNEGMLARPIIFREKMKTITSKWGNHGTGTVTSSVITNAAWKFKKCTAYLLVNGTNKRQTQKVAFNSIRRGFDCQKIKLYILNKTGTKEMEMPNNFERKIDLAPYSAEIMLMAPASSNISDCLKPLKEAFSKIANFKRSKRKWGRMPD